MKIASMVCDHKGKASSGRLASLAGTAAGVALAVAPLWGGPTTDIGVLIAVFSLPSGIGLGQKVFVEKPKDPEEKKEN